jgi:hypothetical protein
VFLIQFADHCHAQLVLERSRGNDHFRVRRPKLLSFDKVNTVLVLVGGTLGFVKLEYLAYIEKV